MAITQVNSTHASIVPENGYWGVGKYKARAHSDANGYALVTPSTADVQWDQ